MGVDMSPEEWNNQKRIESGANKLWDKISDQGRFNVFKAMEELRELLDVIDDEFAVTKKQREPFCTNITNESINNKNVTHSYIYEYIMGCV